jgi:hypothetical protein
MDSDTPFDDEPFFEERDLAEWEFEDDDDEELEPPAWRRPAIIGVALLTVLAMALVPLYNLINGGQRTVADNGLEVCGFDYCIIQDEMRASGLDLAMSRFSTFYLDDEAATRLANLLVDYLNVQPVSMVVLDNLEGRREGQYDATTRTILIERPARAWTVLHEVAHTVATGHGDDFSAALVDLTAWLDSTLID